MTDDIDDEAAKGAKVKKAMGNKRPVKPGFAVIDGGKAEVKPRAPRKRGDKASAEADAGYSLYGGPPVSDGEAAGDDSAGQSQDFANFDETVDGGSDSISPEELELARYCAQNFDQNDRDNGRRLVVWYGYDIAYIAGMGWMVFVGTNWKRDEGELLVRLKAQNLVDKIKLEAVVLEPSPKVARLLAAAEAAAKKATKDVTDHDRALISKAAKAADQLSKKRAGRRTFAINSGNAGKTAAMLTQAESHRAIDKDRLDHDHWQFNCMSGTLEFCRIDDPEQDLTPEADGTPITPRRIGHFVEREHRREDMNTKIADVRFEENASCPRWMEWLERMQPDPLMRRWLQVFHGYAMLTGGNDAQRIIYHYGLGSNGKSIFIETLGRLAGTFRTTVSPDTLTGDQQRGGQQASPDIARLHNARVAIVEELPRGVPLRENLVKAVSGGAPMTARFLQKELFEFKPIFVAILSGNELPEISGLDNGIWRRVMITPWEVTISEREAVGFEDLLARFEPERPGILNWLIEGMLLYLRDGLEPHVAPRVRELTQGYRDERDIVGQFLAACVAREEGHRVQAKDMFDAFSNWCEANAKTAWKQTAFGRRMNTLGYKKEEGRLVYYLDVRLGDVPSRFDPKSPAPPADTRDPGWQPSQL